MSPLSLEDRHAFAWEWLLPAARGALVVAWLLLGLLFVVRRFLGELQPLSPVGLLLAGTVLASLAWLMRRLLSPPLGKYLPAITLALFAVALSIPGTAWWALLGFWLLLVGEAVASGWSWTPAPVANVTATSLTNESEGDDEELEEEPGLLPPEVSQQITRGRATSGDETLTCLSRVLFASGEQTHTLHIAFCPPLDGELTLRHECLEGAACECKVAALESFGARLEIKRRSPLTLADESLFRLEITSQSHN